MSESESKLLKLVSEFTRNETEQSVEKATYAAVDIGETDNLTFPPEINMSPCAAAAGNLQTPNNEPQSAYLVMRYYVYHIILPTVFLIGIVGNTISLVLGNRLRRGMSPIERSAAVGLIALAASDLLFCAVGVLELLTVYPTTAAVAVADGEVQRPFSFYYELFRLPFYNVFLLTSTWIVVVVSAERCLAVSQPIKARLLTIRPRRAVVVYASVFVLSAVVTGPMFFRNRVKVFNCAPGCRCMFTVVTEPFLSGAVFRRVYHVVWLVVGNLVPLGALLIFGSVLIRVLYRRRGTSTAVVVQPTDSPGGSRYGSMARWAGASTATMKVVATVASFLVLVCPSIVAESIGLIVGVEQMTGRQLDCYRIVVVLTNLAQSLKFAGNFVFYVRLDRICKRRRLLGRLPSNDGRYDGRALRLTDSDRSNRTASAKSTFAYSSTRMQSTTC